MKPLQKTLVVITCLLLTNFVWSAQAKRLRGRLPAGYGRLGFSQAQKQAAYRIQAGYKAKIQSLEDQIKKLKEEELTEINKLLTPIQRALLQEQEKAKAARLAERQAEEE